MPNLLLFAPPVYQAGSPTSQKRHFSKDYFTVQACRGKKEVSLPPTASKEGCSVSDEPVIDSYDDADPSDINLDAVTWSEQSEETEVLNRLKLQVETEILNDKEDFLVILATAEGYASYRTDSGSYLLQAFCEEVEKSTIFDDLKDVVQKCRWRTYKMSRERQMPQVLCTLRARLCIKRFEEKNDRKTILVFDRIKQPWGIGDNHLIKHAYPINVTQEEYDKLKKDDYQQEIEDFMWLKGFKHPPLTYMQYPAINY